MNIKDFNDDLCGFLDRSPTPFHATANISAVLLAAGFRELRESDEWSITHGESYFVRRGESSIIGFSVNPEQLANQGLGMVGGHTDSPCLKLKPNAAFKAHGYWQLGVEVYGGVLLNPWFDRDLSLAGRVSLQRQDGQLVQLLINFKRPIAIIPSLAIHLDREANKTRSINPQTYLPPVMCMAGKDEAFDLETEILTQVKAEHPQVVDTELLAFDLSLYGCESARIIGLREDFIAAPRLDNLLSCYAGARALADDRSGQNKLLVCNDHEEVGSGSAVGARGPFLRSVLERLTSSNESYARTIARSILVSTDNAHGVHPNFSDRHDKEHLPLLNGGPAIKVNANQAYASDSETIAIFKDACARADVPVQTFVSRADVACGSTIGPLTATALGVRTVDVGVPTFAMHSIRELAGSSDPVNLYRALMSFYGSR